MKKILIGLLVLVAASCTKEVSEVKKQDPLPNIQICAEPTPELLMVAGRKNLNKGKGKPAQDTTKPTTGNIVKGVIQLVTNGYSDPSAMWGYTYLSPSGLSDEAVNQVSTYMKGHFSRWYVEITTSDSVYYSYPANKRIRVVIMNENINAGGMAYINSMEWANDTYCIVWSGGLGYNTKWISDAGSHEAGHMIGLRHDAHMDGCTVLGEYLASESIMGVSYNFNSLFKIGTTRYCTTQDAPAIIGTKFSTR